ncbi:MAG: 1-deoxy-D-xylulose-5-phosphate reductoisomerase [Steroidobacteraceae bacterium]
MKSVTILGATGSIGRSTLDVIGRHPDRYRVVALTGASDDRGLAAQCLIHRPECAVMVDADAAGRLARTVADAGLPTRVLCGTRALEEVAAREDVDIVMAAIVGAAGLLPTLAAAHAGKRVLLANKEALVCAGHLLLEAVRAGGATLLPIDSEHNAIFQCMPADARAGETAPGVRRILLTASGGPFRTTPAADLARVTPAQAVAHPRWNMGRKISVDSATLMNKGLEIIEACHLFAVPPARVEVVVHPQSVVHSLVEYVDGSVLAELGNPDMRTPIAQALAWPDRIDSGVESLDLVGLGRLDFETPDLERFPCLRLARTAALTGGTAPAALNAANEVAVAAFLAGQLNFPGIPAVIEGVLDVHETTPVTSIDDVLSADARARDAASALLARHAVTAA